MKIAVMGGTPVDSRLGKELLEKHGFVDILPVPISNNFNLHLVNIVWLL